MPRYTIKNSNKDHTAKSMTKKKNKNNNNNNNKTKNKHKIKNKTKHRHISREGQILDDFSNLSLVILI